MDLKRKVEFRRCLNRIANHLSRQNFDDLRFMCKDVVPVARMERVRSPIDLFQALEERGKMSADQLDYLSDVLVSVGCGRLLKELADSGFPVTIPGQGVLGGAVNGLGRGDEGKTAEFQFTQCLVQIAQQLQSREIETLSFTWSEALLGLSADKVFSATQLFQLLQQRQIITTTNLRPLYDELHEVGRSDLAGKINDYLDRTGQRRYPLPVDGLELATGGYGQSPYPVMTPSSPESSLTSSDSTPSFPCTDTKEVRMTDIFGSQGHSHLALRTGLSHASTVTVDPSSSAAYATAPGGNATVASDTHVYQPQDSVIHEYPQGSPVRMVWGSGRVQDSATSRVVHGVPTTTQPHISLEETSPYELSAIAGNPHGLTFPQESEERQRTSYEAQQLLDQLSAKEAQFANKEREMEQLARTLEDARRRNEGLIAERVGEAEVYLTSIRELEELLMRKNSEVESLRVELERFHEEAQALHASRGHINPDELYQMNKNPHGICLIINNSEFYHPTDPSKAHPNRGGSEIDQFNLTQTFRYLRYKVEVRQNLTSAEMTDTMMQLSQQDHSNYDSFVCCVLTHGEANVVHGSDSTPVPIGDLTGLMKYCRTLAGKPKMFFIQACRGEDEDKGVQLEDFQKDSGGTKSVIPQGADFFFGYATPPDFAAYRSRRHGSWYISELCKVFTDNAYHGNLSSMMKKVNNNVTKAFTKEGRKQCPEVVDRLRNEVHFFHFIKNKPRH